MKCLIAGIVLALVAICPFVNSQAVTYDFEEAVYSLTETRDDNPVTGVTIIRSGSTAAASGTIVVRNTCPRGIRATAEHLADYIFDSTVSFNAGVDRLDIDITIEKDEDDESEEIFCLEITTDPGTEQPYAVFSIPANDYCYRVPSSGGQVEYDIVADKATYSQVWNTDEILEIDITPDAGSGDDVCIYLTNLVDTQSADFKYYAIILDDSAAATHHTTTPFMNGHSAIYNNGLGTHGVTSIPGPLLSVGSTFNMWITFNRITGLLSYGETSNSPLDSFDFSSGDTYDIRHVWVATCGAATDFTTFKIRQTIDPVVLIPAVSATSNSFQLEGEPVRAIDGQFVTTFSEGSCFLSANIVDPWIRLDLGIEYYVQYVQIETAEDESALNIVQADIDNARVSVGSCDSNNLSDNLVCSSDIGTVANDPNNPFEVECPARTVGRYVYVWKDTNNAAQFAACEISVYGKEVTYDSDDRTVVQFMQSSYDVSENAIPTITATRTGERATCTYVEYFTREKVAIGGESDDLSRDFTSIPMYDDAPKILVWTDNSADEQTLSDVALYNDDICEDDETFTVELLTDSIVGGSVGRYYWTYVIIKDDDSVTFSLEPVVDVYEGSGPIDITVNRVGTVTGTGTMQESRAELVFTDDDTDSHRDYTVVDPILVFGASSSADSEEAEVNLIDDECYEPDETFTVSLGDLSPEMCSSTSAPVSVDVTILDDDSQFEFDVDTGVFTVYVAEGQDLPIDITRIGTQQDKTLEFDMIRVSSSLSDDDYSVSPSDKSILFRAGADDGTLTISAADDYLVESEEYLTVYLIDPYWEACGGANLGSKQRLNVVITDNDAEYSWKYSSQSVDESDGSVQVCLERTGDTTTSQNVQITSASISATSGVDFSPLNTIAFNSADGSEKCVQVQITPDSLVEGPHTFTLTIDNNQNLAIGSQNVLTITINDDDSVVSWERSEYTALETQGSVNLRISKTGDWAISVVYSTNSVTATSGIDFTPVSRTITIPANANSYDVVIDITDDEVDDNSESFTVTLSSPSSGASIATGVATVRITDDDPPPTQAPPEDGLSGGAIAGIVVAAVVGALVIIGAIAFFLFAAGGGAAAAGAAGVGTAGVNAAQLGNYGYANGNGLQNYSINGYDSALTGFNNFGQRPLY